MNEIVGIGANVYDTMAIVSEYPTENTKLRAESVKPAGGGPTATGLVAAAKLGAAAAYLGSVSDDAVGGFLLGDFEKYGVSTEFVSKVPGCAAFTSYVMINVKGGTRTVVFDKGNLPALSLDNAKKRAITEAKVLMVDGNDLDAATDAARLARASGVRVLYDAGGRYPGVEKLLPFADVLIPSEEFAMGITGEATAEDAAVALYKKYNPAVVVVTTGKTGGVMYDGDTCRRYPALPAEVVDSNGAGDVFHGAFAFALTRGFGFYDCCIFSSAVSALKCTGIGSRESVPDYKTVKKYLKEQGYDKF